MYIGKFSLCCELKYIYNIIMVMYIILRLYDILNDVNFVE